MDQYYVVGDPIEHSVSPQLHRFFAEQTGQQLQYDRKRIVKGQLLASLTELVQAGVKGLSVTAPLKEEAFMVVDRLSDRARLAQAVNTIKVNDDGSTYGDNFDGLGLIEDLLVHWHVALPEKRVLLLGAGGAVKGVLGELLAQGCEVVIVNRTPEYAEALCERYGTLGRLSMATLADCDAAHFDVIINGTSAGLYGQRPELPESCIHSEVFCYDMVYGPKPTPFMQWAKNLGAAQVSNGIGMLVFQGAAAFELWRGVKVDAMQALGTTGKQPLMING